MRDATSERVHLERKKNCTDCSSHLRTRVNESDEPAVDSKCYCFRFKLHLSAWTKKEIKQRHLPDCKACVRARIVVGEPAHSFWSIKHRITLSLTAKKNCSKLYNKSNWKFNSPQRVTELEKMTFVFIGYQFIIPKLSFSSLKRVQLYPQVKLVDGLMRGNFLTKQVPIRNDKNWNTSEFFCTT